MAAPHPNSTTPTPMKVIITGGTGLIGSALAHSLSDDGHEVVVLTRDASRPLPQLPESARLAEWDGATGEGWYQEAEGASAIVNLAGENLGPQAGFWTAARRRRILLSRTQAASAVVDALRRVDERPPVLIQGSAVGYYGAHGDEPVREQAAPGDDFLAKVTTAWEAASEPAEALGVRRVLARTGVVLSKRGSSLDLMKLPVTLFVGGPLGNGRQVIPWIHLEDEIRALRFLIEHDETSGPYNLTAPNPVTNKEFMKMLGRVLGRPAFLPTPGFVLRLALGSMATIVLEGQRAVPDRLQAAGFDFDFPNLEGALRDLLKG